MDWVTDEMSLPDRTRSLFIPSPSFVEHAHRGKRNVQNRITQPARNLTGDPSGFHINKNARSKNLVPVTTSSLIYRVCRESPLGGSSAIRAVGPRLSSPFAQLNYKGKVLSS
ncbi:hypothetical protein BaRGS_00038119 [Batillaria attramentaria]|uniref:Uncharacterized protein n=1 Tax=Batillaria attramentaria TaxID=370345 RepID=A0ABD0J6Z7_9CAEN